MRYDLWKFGLLMVLAAIAGWILGATLLVMLLVSLGIIIWQIFRVERLLKWVRNPNKTSPPDSGGQLYSLIRVLSRRETKNRKRKKQLSAYLKQFRRAASALPDAIVLLDTFGKIEWANKNARQILGIEWPQDANVRFADLVRDPEVNKLLQSNDQNQFSQGVEISNAKNTEFIVNIKVVPYTNDLRMVIARDVSRLVKVNKMQSDFVANVSHELKTPLTVLKGYLEIIDNYAELPENLAKPIEQMSAQSDRMQLIVQDLLYLAKLEDKGQISEQIEIDITPILNGIIETAQEKVQLKQQKIEIDINSDIHLKGNATELHAAFSNLIFNAINYTPEDGIVKIKWGLNKYGGATFQIKDNGEGIASHHIARLTRRFYRVDSDRSRQGGGTGLGLAIVKHVLERHSAQLEIDSSVGVGSEFRCLFPQDKVVDTQSENKIA